MAVGGIALALAGNALMIAAGRMADEEKDGLGALAKELLPPESGEAAH